MNIDKLKEDIEDLRGLEALRDDLKKALNRNEVMFDLTLLAGENKEAIMDSSTYDGARSMFDMFRPRMEEDESSPVANSVRYQRSLGGNNVRVLLGDFVDDVNVRIAKIRGGLRCSLDENIIDGL